jgi:hypothetical protein
MQQEGHGFSHAAKKHYENDQARAKARAFFYSRFLPLVVHLSVVRFFKLILDLLFSGSRNVKSFADCKAIPHFHRCMVCLTVRRIKNFSAVNLVRRPFQQTRLQLERFCTWTLLSARFAVSIPRKSSTALPITMSRTKFSSA